MGFFNRNGAAAAIQNSIVADNSPLNCAARTSDGYNLSSDRSCTFHATGDLNATKPQLGPLGDNGGQTQTMALSSHSPALDAGNPDGCTDGRRHLLTGDQRGKPRPDRDDALGCDIGAFERQGI